MELISYYDMYQKHLVIPVETHCRSDLEVENTKSMATCEQTMVGVAGKTDKA